jgi:hypothetical protein
MAILGDLLFPPADYRRTTLSTIAWWERRRGPFNLIVGASGVVTLVFVRLIALVPPGLPAMKPNLAMLAAVAAYGLMANVCYTFGWGVELMLRRILGKRAPAIGPALFRQGVAFSVGLTLLPILIVSIGWLARLGAWLFLR